VRCADAGQAARDDLAALGDKLLQEANLAVWDSVDLLGAELADLLAAEELASATTRTAGAGGTTAAGTARTRAGAVSGVARAGVAGVRRAGMFAPRGSFRSPWIFSSWCAGFVSHKFLIPSLVELPLQDSTNFMNGASILKWP
jgi:hypothetical protein